MKRIVYIVLTLLSALAAPAQTAVPAKEQERIVGEIAAAAREVTSLQCDFVQTRTLSIMDEKMVSRGTMVFQRPDRLRWQYTSPYDYTFIIAGDRVHIGKGAKKNSIDLAGSRTFQEIARMMAGSVTGRCLTDKADFDVQMQRTGDSYIAVLTPRKSQVKKMFRQIRLTFSRKTRTVTRVEMTDTGGDATTIDMLNTIQNGRVPNGAFVLD